MNGQRPPYLRPANETDPIWQLLQELPPQWRGPIIGPAIDNWEKITENAKARIKLHGLPETIAAELAWMAHWQALDGTRSSVLATNQMANILRLAIREQHPFPPSIRAMDWDQAAALQRWFYATRWGRLPPHGSIARLRVMFRFARLALLARCHDGHWWDLDEWHPRCDPRIPLTGREPQANYGCSPGQIRHRWLREAAKWYLGTALEAGTLRWSTVSQERVKCLTRFDRWLSTVDDPLQVLGDPANAAAQAAAFRRWDADPANRLLRSNDRRFADRPVHPRQINRDDHDSMHLFDRADRFLPNGWCLLPPLQSCDKGNACLTCSVFATDVTHRTVLERQLDNTTTLIDRTTTEFEIRHGSPMPDDNVWLTHRRAEKAALTKLLEALPTDPGRAIQGGGSHAATTGPVPLTLIPITRRTRP